MDNKMEKIKKDMEMLARELKALPLDVELDTEAQEAIVDGVSKIVGRAHEYKVKSGKQNGKIYSVTELTKEFSKYAGKDTTHFDRTRADYGTLFHRIIQELEGKKNPFGLKGKNDVVTEKQIRDVVRKLSSPSAHKNDRADAVIMQNAKTQREQEKYIKSLVNNVNQYVQLRERMGIASNGKKNIEKALGMTVTYKGKKYDIAGTLDQLFSQQLRDLKTSQEVGPDYGLQLQLLDLLAYVNGLKVSGSMKLINTPAQLAKNDRKTASIVDVTRLNPQMVKKLLTTALDIKNAPDAKTAEALRTTGKQLLGLGGIKFKLPGGVSEFNDKNGQIVKYASYGGKSINQLVKYVNEHGSGYRGIKALASAMDANTSSRFVNSIFTRQAGGGFKYNDKTLDVYRYLTRPEFYHSLWDSNPEMQKQLQKIAGVAQGRVSDKQIATMLKNGQLPLESLVFQPKSLDTIAKEISLGKAGSVSGIYEKVQSKQFDPHYLMGDYSLTDLLNLLASVNDPAAEAALFRGLHSSLKKGLVNGSVDEQHMISNFLRGAKTRWEEGVAKGVKTPKQQKLDKLISNLLLRDDVISTVLRDDHEFSTVNEMVGETNYRYKHTGDLTPEDDDYYNNLVDSFLKQGKSPLGHLQKYDPKKADMYKAQLPHRLARMLQAHSLYDQAFTPLYEKSGDLFGSYDEFLNTILQNNPQMLKQYNSSKAFAKWYKEASDKYPAQNIFQLLNNRDLIAEGVTIPHQFGGYGMYAELANIFSLIRDIQDKNPNLLKDSEMLGNFQHQVGGRKMEYWDEHNEAARLLSGLPIDNLLYFFNTDESKKTYTATMRNLGLWKSKGLAKRILSKSLLEQDTSHLGYEMFGSETDLFKDILDNFNHEYLIWKEGEQSRLDKKYGEGSYDEDKFLDRRKFFNSAAGKSFLQNNELVQKYKAIVDFVQKEVVPVMEANAKIAEQQEFDEQHLRHEIDQTQGRSRKKAAVPQEDILNDSIITAVLKRSDPFTPKGSTEEINNAYTLNGMYAAQLLKDPEKAQALIAALSNNPEDLALFKSTLLKEIAAHPNFDEETKRSFLEKTGLFKNKGSLTRFLNSSKGYRPIKDFNKQMSGVAEQIEDAKPGTAAVANAEEVSMPNSSVVVNAETVQVSGGATTGGSGSGDGSDDKKSDAQIKKEADKKAKAEAQAKIKAEREYASLMKQRNQLLGSNQGLEYALNHKGAMPGAGFRNRGTPLTKEQKQGYAEMIGINNEKLGSVNQRLAALRAGGLISDEALAKMDADAALSLRALQAQAKMNGGGGSGGGFLGGRTLVGSLKESLGNMVQWSLSISLAYKILGAFTKGLQKTIQAVQTMDSAMMNLRIVTGASKEDASALISGYAKLADQLSVTTSEVTQSAAAWMRQGYSIQETGELIKASMYLAKLGFTDVNTATSVLTSTLKGFKLQASDAVSIVDKLTKLDMSAAITATDIGQGLAQFAATGSLAGLTTDQAAALVTTIADVSQKSGSEVGNALRTIISRYSSVKAGKYNLLNTSEDSGDTAERLNDVETVLNKIGISLRSSNLEFREFDDVIADVAAKWKTLDTVSKKALSTAFAGVRQQEYFNVLMENYDNYEKYLKISEESTGTAEEKYESYTEALEASQKRIQAAWENLAKDSNLADIMTKVNNFLADAVKILPRLIKHASTLLLTLKGYKLVGAALSFVGGGIPFIGGRISTAGNALYTKGGLQGLTGESVQQLSISKKITAEFQKMLLLIKRGTAAEQQQTLEDEKQLIAEKQGTTTTGAGSAAGAGRYAGAMGTVIGAVAGIVINQAMAAVSTYLQSGASHSTATGETVDSSEEAKKAYKSVATVWTALVPVAGQFIGEAVGDRVAQEIDRARDERNARVNAAETMLSALSSTRDNSQTLAKLGLSKTNWTESDTEDAEKAASALLDTMYTKDNEETRNLLEKKLNSVLKDLGEGNDISVSLYEAVKKIQDGDAESAERYSRALMIATLQTESDAKLAAFEDDFAGIEQQIGSVYNVVEKGIITSEAEKAKFNAEAGWNAGAIANGVGGAGMGLLAGGMAGGAAASAIGTGTVLGMSAGPVGALVGLIVGGLVAAGFGIGSAIMHQKAEEAGNEAYQETYDRLVKEYNNKTVEEQIQFFEDAKKSLEAAETTDYETLSAIEEGLNTLRSIKGQMQKIYDEMNTIAAQQALYSAKSGENYLADMTIGELKRLGVDEIISITAQELEKAGVYSMDVFDSNGNVTEVAKNLIKKTLMSDNEIAAVLSGQSYTLSEALKLDRSSGYNLDILENFANAIHVSVDELDGLADSFGQLTLQELLSSVEDLNNQLNSTLDLIQKINDPTVSINDWMGTLISSYPELIKYIGDVDKMNQALLEKEEQLNNAYLNNQFTQITSSEKYYEDIKDSILDTIGDVSEEAQAQLDKFSTLDQLIKWIASAPEDQQDLAEQLRNALAKQMEGVNLRSNAVQMANVKKYVEAVTADLDKQITNLNEQKEALQNITSTREYENKLIQARLNLEAAGKEKKRVYRAGVGWVYEADQESLRKAQDELDKLDTEKTIAEMAAQIAQLEKEKTDLESIEKNKQYEALQEWRKSFESHDGITGSVADILVLLSNIYDGVSQGFNSLTDQTIESTRINRANALTKLHEAEQAALAAYQTRTTNPKAYNEAQANLSSLYGRYQRSGLVSMGDLTDEGWKMATGATGYGQQIVSSIYKVRDPKGNGYFELTSKEVPAINEANNIFEHIKNGSEDVYLFTSSAQNGIKLSSLGIVPTMDDTASSYFANSSFNGALIYDAESGEWIKIFANKALGIASNKQTGSLDTPVWNQTAALGSLGVRGGATLLNEYGTEAIITPAGTIAALPSATGVVPADITKNLWELGEIAPLIQRALLGGFSDFRMNANAYGTDESFNVGTINMTVNADETFDVDQFIDTVKARVSLTKNNKY